MLLIMGGNHIQQGLTKLPLTSLGAEPVTLGLIVDRYRARNTQFGGRCCYTCRSQHVRNCYGESAYALAV